MNKTRINKSWREQAKPVIAFCTDGRDVCHRFPSVWQAASWISLQHSCLLDTAKKEIRKAIKTGGVRYGLHWKFEKDKTSN